MRYGYNEISRKLILPLVCSIQRKTQARNKGLASFSVCLKHSFDDVRFLSFRLVKEFPCGAQLVAHYAEEFLTFLQYVKVEQ